MVVKKFCMAVRHRLSSNWRRSMILWNTFPGNPCTGNMCAKVKGECTKRRPKMMRSTLVLSQSERDPLIRRNEGVGRREIRGRKNLAKRSAPKNSIRRRSQNQNPSQKSQFWARDPNQKIVGQKLRHQRGPNTVKRWTNLSSWFRGRGSQIVSWTFRPSKKAKIGPKTKKTSRSWGSQSWPKKLWPNRRRWRHQKWRPRPKKWSHLNNKSISLQGPVEEKVGENRLRKIMSEVQSLCREIFDCMLMSAMPSITYWG